MKAMEKKYCVERIDGIYRKKVREVEEKYTKDGHELDFHEKIELIYSAEPPPLISRAAAMKIKDSYRYGRLAIFDFSCFESEEEVDRPKIDAAKVKLEAKRTSLNDEIMLGDAQEMLKAITMWELSEVK